MCAEPLCYRPWEVGRLTPFQVHEVLMVERDKKGAVMLDGPLGDDEVELSMAVEWRREWMRCGVTDPDALRLLVERSMAEDAPAEPTDEGDD